MNKRKLLPSSLINSIYAKELLAASEVAVKAGNNMLHSSTEDGDITIKGDNNFVTKTDVQNETLIYNTLKHIFPHYNFIGEVRIGSSLSNAWMSKCCFNF